MQPCVSARILTGVTLTITLGPIAWCPANQPWPEREERARWSALALERKRRPSNRMPPDAGKKKHILLQARAKSKAGERGQEIEIGIR